MTKIIAIANQKGGVGKTTTTLNLGASLIEKGKKTLLLDLDPQGSLTTSLGFEPEQIEQTIYSVLQATIEEKNQPTLRGITLQHDSGLHLIPANLELSAAEIDLFQATMGELILREAIQTESQYDFILIDCPPNLGGLTINALSASHEVLIPLQADYLAMKGVKLLMRTIATVQRKINRELRIAGILLTMADLRTRHAREVIEQTRKVLGDQIRVFESIIKVNVQVKESTVIGESILSYSTKSNVAEAYRALANEILNDTIIP